MFDTLISFVTVVLALSIASERLVELFKGFFPTLTGKDSNAEVERKRQLRIHWSSVVASAIVVALMQDYISSSVGLKNGLGWPEGVAFTILASGGSSTWNSVVSYLLSLKNIKQQAVESTQKVGNTDLFKGLPLTMPTL